MIKNIEVHLSKHVYEVFMMIQIISIAGESKRFEKKRPV